MLSNIIKSIYTKITQGRSAVEPTRVSGENFKLSKQSVSRNALKILNRINDSGFQAYLVGGCVRDLMVGLYPKDFDVVTNAVPQEVKKLFRNSLYIGRRFKIIHVLFGREVIEVITFRRDRKLFLSFMRNTKKQRMLANNTYGDMEHDVYRRDFTINALYYDSKRNEIIDYVGGVEDIKKRRIQIIGEATIRFSEDPIRILRAVRFAAKLNFDLADDVSLAIEACKTKLHTVSTERLFLEVNKLFDQGHGWLSYQILCKRDLLDTLLPEYTAQINPTNKDKFTALIKIALNQADQRIAQKKHTSISFILAVLLWHCIMSRLATVKYTRKNHEIKFPKAARTVLKHQLKYLSVPRRILDAISTIWEFQLLFPQSHGNRANKLHRHPRFKAAYDLLLIRAQVDVDLAEEALWWTQYIKQPTLTKNNHTDT